eukprot:7042645-Pyramimonas_sp.AAC.1
MWRRRRARPCRDRDPRGGSNPQVSLGVAAHQVHGSQEGRPKPNPAPGPEGDDQEDPRWNPAPIASPPE